MIFTSFLLSKPKDNSDGTILSYIINLIYQKQEYQIDNNLQIYPINLVEKYALEYFNRVNFDFHMNSNNFYYYSGSNTFISYYNNSSNIVINGYEIVKLNNKIIANYKING